MYYHPPNRTYTNSKVEILVFPLAREQASLLVREQMIAIKSYDHTHFVIRNFHAREQMETEFYTDASDHADVTFYQSKRLVHEAVLGRRAESAAADTLPPDSLVGAMGRGAKSSSWKMSSKE